MPLACHLEVQDELRYAELLGIFLVIGDAIDVVVVELLMARLLDCWASLCRNCVELMELIVLRRRH